MVRDLREGRSTCRPPRRREAGSRTPGKGDNSTTVDADTVETDDPADLPNEGTQGTSIDEEAHSTFLRDDPFEVEEGRRYIGTPCDSTRYATRYLTAEQVRRQEHEPDYDSQYDPSNEDMDREAVDEVLSEHLSQYAFTVLILRRLSTT